MENFTPLSSLIGGILIGLSATAMLGLLGRVAGISGIVGALLARDASGGPWRADASRRAVTQPAVEARRALPPRSRGRSWAVRYGMGMVLQIVIGSAKKDTGPSAR